MLQELHVNKTMGWYAMQETLFTVRCVDIENDLLFDCVKCGHHRYTIITKREKNTIKKLENMLGISKIFKCTSVM